MLLGGTASLIIIIIIIIVTTDCSVTPTRTPRSSSQIDN